MEKAISFGLGTALATLTASGFIQGKKHFLGLMNVDVNHSLLRIPLTVALLYAGTEANLRTTRKVLLGVGVFYLGMGTAGLVDKRVGGLLPSKLTNFDIAYHFATGAAAIWLGTRSGRMMKP